MFVGYYSWTNPSVESEIKCLKVLRKGIKVGNTFWAGSCGREKFLESRTFSFTLCLVQKNKRKKCKDMRLRRNNFVLQFSTLIENSTIKGGTFSLHLGMNILSISISILYPHLQNALRRVGLSLTWLDKPLGIFVVLLETGPQCWSWSRHRICQKCLHPRP